MGSKAREYVMAAASAIASNNATRVAGHFGFSKAADGGGPSLQLLARRELVRMYQARGENEVVAREVAQVAARSIGDNWASVLEAHLRVLLFLSLDRYEAAFQEQETVVREFMKIFEPAHWGKVFKLFLKQLRSVAMLADERGGQREEPLAQQAARDIQRILLQLQQDRAHQLYALYVACQLFRLYFKLKNIQLCKDLLKNLKARGLPDVSQYSISQQVTYLYFLGRLALIDNNFISAESHLTAAFEKCTKHHAANKRRILFFLVPAKLLTGSMPRTALLEKYSLSEYIPLTNAIRTGNLLQLRQTLQENQELFVKQGIFLILEKLKLLVYRTLFKRVHTLRTDPRPILPLKVIGKALSWTGNEMELEEVECVLATLIYKGYIKGYLSHERGALVLSKDNPFPAVRALLRRPDS